MTSSRRSRASAGLLAFAALVCIALPSAAFAAPTVIRTGGPSAPHDSKIAILASNRNLGGARFAVSRGANTVLRGRLHLQAGKSSPWRHAYRADLSGLRRPGLYRVHAAGIVSRPWRISAAGSSGVIPLILRFFRTNRDGNEPALLHAPSHLHDARIKGGPQAGQHFDLTGGWMDAGDMLHFTDNAAFSAEALEAAARIDSSNRAALRREAAVGIRWLLKAHPAPGLFITQVGDERDHERGFGDPAADDASGKPGIAHRLAFHWGKRVGGDIGGKVAAALAMAAHHSGGSRRALLISQAKQWYASGRRSGRATPKLPGSGGFYVVENWRDSLAAGAAALYRVTGKQAYLTAALKYLHGSSPYDVIGYSNVAPLAAADICGRLGAPALGGRAAGRKACRFLRLSGGQGASYARADAFGEAGYFTWGTTETNSAGGALAKISGLRVGRRVAAGARDYLLGRNPWGASFVAGFGPHSPRKVHSWASHFGDGKPDGAVVGGPAPIGQLLSQSFHPGGPLRAFNSKIVYEDRRTDYVTAEPTIDSAASSILLLAALDQRN